MLSGLNVEYFNENEKQLINRLIQQDEWIEEETTDLFEMFNQNAL